MAPHAGQFARMPAWLAQHSDSLCSKLTPDLILFGEWCAAWQRSRKYYMGRLRLLT